ncbi:MAG: zinc metalloprotease [Pirellulales bacterium]|nr:zinc metalloprotease [Pirellulales bacterium]
MAKKKKTAVKGKSAEQPPKRRMCGTMQVHQWLLESHPGFRKEQVEIESAMRSRLMAPMAARTSPYKITVVVHVVFRSAAENISDAQIKSQIDVLNKDFRAKNSDRSKTPPVWKGLTSDAMVEFSLATKDPSGKATTGITRTSTSTDGFGDDDNVKFTQRGGIDAWPTNKYLNIWVCQLRGGLLGYAQFPGGPKATDGVVILSTAFGTKGTARAPFNKGRTTTHEIGHYLNLRHIWGDTEDCSGTDLVADTPNAVTPNYGKPTFPHVSCHNGPHGDMFMNYMDYVDDDAMFMFTTGQVARMRMTLDGPRKSLVS